MHKRLFFVITLAISAALASPALAWGDFAHRLTARIAMAGLTPAARAEVGRILARGSAVETPTCPLATFEDASVWPDCARALGERFAFSSPWHYQNISVCQAFDIAAKCPGGDCVTAQIPRQLAIVADRGATPAARAQALAFVVHFVGDMHMPLHLGDKGDRGGNDVRAAYGVKAPERMNLHRIWDSDLAERALTEPPAVTGVSLTRVERARLARGDVADWAREAWEVSRTVAYPALHGVPDGCTAPPSARPLIDEAYVAASRTAVRLQVERAGARMAMLLNAALAR